MKRGITVVVAWQPADLGFGSNGIATLRQCHGCAVRWAMIVS